MPTPVIINCEKLPFVNTLGVAYFVLRLARSMSEIRPVFLAVSSVDAFDRSPARPFIKGSSVEVFAIGSPELKSILQQQQVCEILCHHFQAPLFNVSSISLCFDLHCFDIPWKYGDYKAVQNNFINNLSAANSIVTMFPRTYYDLEMVTGRSFQNTFLLSAPLLIDDSIYSEKNAPQDFSSGLKRKETILLYPAQFQFHKGHIKLIDAFSDFCENHDRDVKLVFCGADFKTEVTNQIHDHAINSSARDNIEFLGHLSERELIEWYHRCDGVIVPSEAEGGCYVGLEALAAGKPAAINRLRSAVLHANSVGFRPIWFNIQDMPDTVKKIGMLVNLRGINMDHRAALNRLRSLRWATVACELSDIVDYTLGMRAKPLLRVDANGKIHGYN